MARYHPDGDPGFGYRGGGGWLRRTATLGSGTVGVGDGSGYLLPREGVGAAAAGGDAEGEVGGVGGDELSSLVRLDEDGLTRGEHAREADVAPRGEVPAEAAQVLGLDVEPARTIPPESRIQCGFSSEGGVVAEKGGAGPTRRRHQPRGQEDGAVPCLEDICVYSVAVSARPWCPRTASRTPSDQTHRRGEQASPRLRA